MSADDRSQGCLFQPRRSRRLGVKKTPVPVATPRGINRNTGWGRRTGSRRDTELAEWGGNGWRELFSLAALLLLSVGEREGAEKPRSRQAAKGRWFAALGQGCRMQNQPKP
jgi:hypothetical protein